VAQAGGIAVLLSPKKEGRVLGLASGGSLAEFKPNSFENHALAVSANGRFICVASFTADVMVSEQGTMQMWCMWRLLPCCICVTEDF
jgi:hypothetical protein